MTSRVALAVLLLLLGACPPVGLDPVVTASSSSGDAVTAATTGDDPEPTGSTGSTTTDATTTADTTTADTTTGDTTDTTITSATTGTPIDCEVVEFASPTIEAKVRESLAQPDGPILGDSLLAITDLIFGSAGEISSLGGLECMPGLQSLTIAYHPELVDLAPLAGLDALTKLSITTCSVSDLAPLADLAALTHLWLIVTEVSDLSPLAGLTTLKNLDLSVNPLVDLSPLAGLVALDVLSLRSTEATDITPLAGLDLLDTLILDDTPVGDLGPLAGLPALRTLHASDTPISDLAPLTSVTTLRDVRLANTGVVDLTPLAASSGLRELHLSNTPVSDLGPLSGMTIRRLQADNCQVTSLAAIATLPDFLHVDLTHNLIVDVEPLLSAERTIAEGRADCADVFLAENPLAPGSGQIADAATMATNIAIWTDQDQMLLGSTCIMP